MGKRKHFFDEANSKSQYQNEITNTASLQNNKSLSSGRGVKIEECKKLDVVVQPLFFGILCYIAYFLSLGLARQMF